MEITQKINFKATDQNGKLVAYGHLNNNEDIVISASGNFSKIFLDELEDISSPMGEFFANQKSIITALDTMDATKVVTSFEVRDSNEFFLKHGICVEVNAITTVWAD